MGRGEGANPRLRWMRGLGGLQPSGSSSATGQVFREIAIQRPSPRHITFVRKPHRETRPTGDGRTSMYISTGGTPVARRVRKGRGGWRRPARRRMDRHRGATGRQRGSGLRSPRQPCRARRWRSRGPPADPNSVVADGVAAGWCRTLEWPSLSEKEARERTSSSPGTPSRDEGHVLGVQAPAPIAGRGHQMGCCASSGSACLGILSNRCAWSRV